MRKTIILILPYIIIVGLFQFVGMLISGVSLTEIAEQNHSTDQKLIIRLFDLLGTIITLVILVKFVFKDSILDLGLRRNGFNRQFLAAAAIVIVGIGTMFGILLAIEAVKLEYLNLDYKKLMYSFSLYLMVALSEEFLFRGYIQHYLMESMPKYAAILISSILFTAFHLLNPHISIVGFLSIFVCSILLGISYILTKSIWFPVAFHFWWNFIQAHLGFSVSGNSTYSIMQTSFNGPDYISGGAFGFEGSVFSLLLQALMIITIIGHYRSSVLPALRS